MSFMGDFFGPSPFNNDPRSGRRDGPTTEFGVTWEAKEINGQLFVPVSQVVELLESNKVLPKMAERLKMHLRKKA